MSAGAPSAATAAGPAALIAEGWRRLAAGEAGVALNICGSLLAEHGANPALLALTAAAVASERPDLAESLTAKAGGAALTVGQRHAAARSWPAALAAHRWGMALCPDQPFHHHFAGEALLSLNRLVEAGAAFRRALRLDVEDIPSVFRLADTLVLLGLWKAAAGVIRRALLLAPGHPVPYYLESLRALAFDQPGRALAALDRAARLTPERPAFTQHRGMVLRELGDVPAALAAFRAAVAADPDRTEAYYNAALCMAVLGRSPAELPENGPYAEARLAEGRAAEEAGRFQLAADRYAAALAARPDLPGPAEAQRRLLARWRESLKTDPRPITQRNPDWVVCECYRADVEYRTLVAAQPSYLGLPGRVPARPAGAGRRRVWDAFMFSSELDMLELRLHELAGVVDRFVVVESPWTHQGRPKELLFHANRERFAAFADRIVHVVADERREGVTWEQESYQRNSILKGLTEADDDDLLIICDVDEIPRPEVVTRIADDDRLSARITGLSMTNYNYFINFASYQPVIRPMTLPCGLARRLGTNLARHLLVRAGKHIVPVIPDAGWHFSWVGGVDAVCRKLETFCHLELLETKPTREEVAAMLAAGDFRITSQVLEGRFVPIDASFPEAVRRNADRLRQLGWIWPPFPEAHSAVLPDGVG